MSFFQRLEPYLAEKKLSQKDLADIAGVTPPSVFEWKNEGTMPRADTAIKIADYLHVSVKWLITGEEDDDISNEEKELIFLFKQLDQNDKEEIVEVIRLKLKKRQKGDTLYNSETA